MEISEEDLNLFIEYLWQEELERRVEENGVLKELKYETDEITEVVHQSW